MPRYLNSTHQKCWIFSREDLMKIKDNKNSELCQYIVTTSGDQSLQKYVVTEDEEKAILNFLSKNLITACEHLHLHDKAVSTALTYFRRFYLYNSVCVYDPVQMMFTCMFLACKTEEINVRDVDQFCQHFKESDAKAILQLEYALISGIKFHLYVFCPHKSLRALIMEIGEESFAGKGKEIIQAKSKEVIEGMLMSEISFLASPSEIAVTSLYIALEDSGEKDVIFGKVFEKLGKNYESFREKIVGLAEEYRKFYDDSLRIEAMFRGALKKAGTLRHRLNRKKAA